MTVEEFIDRGRGYSTTSKHYGCICSERITPKVSHVYDEVPFHICFSNFLEVWCDSDRSKYAMFVSATSIHTRNDGTNAHVEGYIEIPDTIEIDDQGFPDFKFLENVFDEEKHLKVRRWCYDNTIRRKELMPYSVLFNWKQDLD